MMFSVPRAVRRATLFVCAAVVSVSVLVSCAPAPDVPEKTVPPSRLLTSDRYTLRVERGKNRVEVVSPDTLAGTYVDFGDTDAHMNVGDLHLPLGENSAAAWRDWLILAYPEDVPAEGEAPPSSADLVREFDRDGAHFTFASDGTAAVERGGVTRSAKVVPEETTETETGE